MKTNYELKMDIYQRSGRAMPQATVMYLHGGFWVRGSKESALMELMPWLEMGWNVVNVEYRLAHVALAPAAVEDCLCALRYLAAQSKRYNIDANRIVVSGASAGGHLALTTGMIPESAGLDRECTGDISSDAGTRTTPLPKVAAIVNFYGVTDVADIMDGPHRAERALPWMGSLPNRSELAKLVSPLTYVRAGLPPILTIHGDKDTTVPYDQAVRLQEALSKAGVPNQLLTISGAHHGGFTQEQRTNVYLTIREFLARYGLGGQ
jgi:acetyl esterase/lipase